MQSSFIDVPVNLLPYSIIRTNGQSGLLLYYYLAPDPEGSTPLFATTHDPGPIPIDSHPHNLSSEVT
jgi:hypothetical protein